MAVHKKDYTEEFRKRLTKVTLSNIIETVVEGDVRFTADHDMEGVLPGAYLIDENEVTYRAITEKTFVLRKILQKHKHPTMLGIYYMPSGNKFSISQP